MLVLTVFVNQFTVRGMNSMEMINAQQAIHHSKSTEEILLKINAVI
jgi:hypothetical protein